MAANDRCTESQEPFLRFGKRVRLVSAEPGERDLPVGKFRVIQKTLKLIVGNRLDFRIDIGAGFADLGEQVGQLCATRKVFIVRTVFGVFERGVVTESFGNLLEPVVALQAAEQRVSRFSEMAFELGDLRIAISSDWKMIFGILLLF